jgi:hypothetical protein
LTKTAALWPDVRRTYGWVHRAAHILHNANQDNAPAVKSRLGGLLGAMARHRQAAGTLAPALDQFLKVTRSYWPGLFHCYAVPDLPGTNNALEQYFGAQRYHERRATGRKTATAALVLRGSVRLVACAATRLREFSPEAIAPTNLDAWQALRHDLTTRCQSRTLQRRFRRNATAYLARLEAELLQLTLPP